MSTDTFGAPGPNLTETTRGLRTREDTLADIITTRSVEYFFSLLICRIYFFTFDLQYIYFLIFLPLYCYLNIFSRAAIYIFFEFALYMDLFAREERRTLSIFSCVVLFFAI